MLALGICCGLRESSLQRNKFLSNYYNYGSYAAASVSLFLIIFYEINLKNDCFKGFWSVIVGFLWDKCVL
jgi:hypothetical protein